jgi:hypothetical protein
MLHPNLEIALRQIGWGDPTGGVWFVGLEGAAAWTNQDELDAFAQRPAAISDGDILYECSDPPSNIADEHQHDPRGQVWRWQSQIATLLSLTPRSVDEYARRCLWFRGSGVFQANLYPLGKPRLSQWPAHYQQLFGLGPADQERYKLIVRKRRFPLIRSFHQRARPQATICFGKTCWNEFEDLFDLWEGPADPESDDNLRSYAARRILLVPFLGVGQMSDVLARRIIARLSDWNVSLP